MSRSLSLFVTALSVVSLSACGLDDGAYSSTTMTDVSTTTGETQSGGAAPTTSTSSGGDAGAPGTGGQGGSGAAGEAGSPSTGGQGGVTTTSTDCTPMGTGPGPAPYPVTIGGQLAWVHDDGFDSGYFHTYDGLAVGGPGDIPRKVHVFLPPEYESTCAKYPVVYMNDGDTAFWPGGAGNKTWAVAQGLSGLYSSSAIEKVIVVAVLPLNRESEYTHTDWAPGHTCCGVTGYANYLADHVKAFIDANYRTETAPARTAILGSSHGGLASFLVANLRPDVFGMAGCLSSSFWAGLDPVHGGSFSQGPLATSALLDMTKGTLSDPAARPRLWIDWGLVRTGGFHNAVIEAAATTRGQEMVTLLTQSYGYVEGASLHSYEDPNGEHDEVSWAKRFPMVMKAFFGGS